MISTPIVNWMKTGMRRFSAAPVNRNVRGEGWIWEDGRRETGIEVLDLGRVVRRMGKGAGRNRTLEPIVLMFMLFVFGMSGGFAQAVGDYRSNAAVMDWATAADWETGNGTLWVPATTYPGQVAGSGKLTIRTGHTVNINASPANPVISLLVEASGILQYEAATARTLMVSDIIRINSGGTFQSALTGGVTTHLLIIAGSIVNEGTLNFSTSRNAAGVGITFTGAKNEAFDLSNATLTNLRAENGLILNKGTSATSILWFTPGGPFQVLSGTSPTEGFLTITSGTFCINGSNAFNDPLFYATTGSYIIPSAGGFLLDNPNATIVGMYGSLINDGEVIIKDGVYNIGTGSGNELLTNSSGRFEMSGGMMNISGRFRISDGDCIITGGTMNLATIGHADRTRAAFYVSPSADLTISGDPLITFAYPNSNSTPFNDLDIEVGTGIKSITGGTFQIGTAATPAYRTFLVNSDIPIHNLVIYNANARVSLTRHLTVNNQLTLNGRLLMNNYYLNLGTPAIAGDFHVNRGLIVPGTGEVRKAIIPGGSYLFPFGSTSYIPVTVDFTGGTFTPGATVSVRMINSKHPENVNTTRFLKRYWTVRTTGITNPVYDFLGNYDFNVDVEGDPAFMTTGIYTTVWEKFSPTPYVPYAIVATGLMGNVDISGINVAAPVVRITPMSALICSRSSVQLATIASGNGTLTYSWTPVGGLSAPTISNPVANPTTTTTYTVRVSDGTGESVSASITITVNPLPTPSLIYHN